jgi:hypothetical protein
MTADSTFACAMTSWRRNLQDGCTREERYYSRPASCSVWLTGESRYCITVRVPR